MPDAWQFTIGNQADATATLTTDPARPELGCVKLTNTTAFAPHTYGTFYSAETPVKPDTDYCLSLWARGEATSACWFGGGYEWLCRKGMPTGDFGWERYSVFYHTRPDETIFTFRINVDGPTKALYIAQAQLVEGLAHEPPTNPDLLEALAEAALERGNLLANGGFEQKQGQTELPASWNFWPGGEAQAEAILEGGEAFTGFRCVRLTNASEYYPNRFGGFSAKNVPVKPDTDYCLSLVAKGQKTSACWFGGGEGWSCRYALPEGDFDWQQFTITYHTGPDEKTFGFRVNVDGPTGALWVDEAQLVEGTQSLPGVYSPSPGAVEVPTSLLLRKEPLIVTALVGAEAAREQILSWQLLDAEGRPSYHGQIPVTFEAEGITVKQVELGLFEPGYYLVKAQLAEGVEYSASLVIVPREQLAPTLDEASPFGVNPHGFGNEAYARPMQYLGAGVVRGDYLEWRGVEPEQGKFDWSSPERELQLANRAGAHLLGLLTYVPVWASSKPDSEDPTHEVPRDVTEWADFVRAAVSAFDGRMPWFELYNEPNIGFFKGTVDQFWPLLREGYTAAKQVAPDTPVVFPGAAGVPLDWIEALYKLGAADYFDIMNVHPYRHPSAPEATPSLPEVIANLRALMERYGDGDKPIWMTEVGYYKQAAEEVHTIPATPEALDACYLVRTYVLALSAGVSKVFWYEYRGDSFGLMRSDGSPRPAFGAYATMTWLLEGKSYVGKLASPEGLELRVFASGEEAIVVAWAPKEAVDYLLDFTPVEAWTLYGAALALPAQGEPIQLDGAPVYLKCKLADVTSLLLK